MLKQHIIYNKNLLYLFIFLFFYPSHLMAGCFSEIASKIKLDLSNTRTAPDFSNIAPSTHTVIDLPTNPLENQLVEADTFYEWHHKSFSDSIHFIWNKLATSVDSYYDFSYLNSMTTRFTPFSKYFLPLKIVSNHITIYKVFLLYNTLRYATNGHYYATGSLTPFDDLFSGKWTWKSFGFLALGGIIGGASFWASTGLMTAIWKTWGLKYGWSFIAKIFLTGIVSSGIQAFDTVAYALMGYFGGTSRSYDHTIQLLEECGHSHTEAQQVFYQEEVQIGLQNFGALSACNFIFTAITHYSKKGLANIGQLKIKGRILSELAMLSLYLINMGERDRLIKTIPGSMVPHLYWPMYRGECPINIGSIWCVEHSLWSFLPLVPKHESPYVEICGIKNQTIFNTNHYNLTNETDLLNITHTFTPSTAGY